MQMEPDPNWNEALTLEEWIESMLTQGYDEIVVMLMKALPEAKRAYYRRVWTRIKEEQRKAHAELRVVQDS